LLQQHRPFEGDRRVLGYQSRAVRRCQVAMAAASLLLLLLLRASFAAVALRL
jgi:hypothetical protein